MPRIDLDRHLSEVRDHIQLWLALWGNPLLAESLNLEWSARLYRSLGRAFPNRRLVRLSPALLTARRDLMLEAVCHEVAHIVVGLTHRRPCQPHGPEWAGLVRTAGFEPRIRVPLSNVTALKKSAGTLRRPRARATNRRIFIHSCPVCHMRRVAWRHINRWRCADCTAAGLEGRLVVEVIRAKSS